MKGRSLIRRPYDPMVLDARIAVKRQAIKSRDFDSFVTACATFIGVCGFLTGATVVGLCWIWFAV